MYELDPEKPVPYVIPVESILGKLPVVPVRDFGSVPNGMRAQFPGALADRTPGARDGCPSGMSTHGRWAGPARYEQDARGAAARGADAAWRAGTAGPRWPGAPARLFT